MLAIMALSAVQAQEKRAIKERKEFRDKMVAEKLNLSDEQKQKARSLLNIFFSRILMTLSKMPMTL